MASEPWAAFGWGMPGDPPGVTAHLRRMEQLERAEEARRRAELEERRDERLQAWALRRMQEMAWRGEPFDPADWRTLAEPESELLARTWAQLDAEDARLHRRTLIDAGLLHELGPVFASPSPDVETLPAAGTAARLSKVQGALRRWSSDRRTAARKAERAEEYENRDR
jgi:hypothetical protein